MAFREWFRQHSQISKIIFFLIVLYAVSSIVILVAAVVFTPYLPAGFYLKPRALILFALISFGLTAFISIYHLSTMIRRRKRNHDLSEEDQKIYRQVFRNFPS